MIPLVLKIKNFLSYGPDLQTIEFSSYPLICLSGKNGHGKSALLDAISWALWGQARKIGGTHKADQGLLHLGQTQMMVSLDFMCNNQQYRVRREYAKTYGKPYSALDFGLLQKDGTLIPLTDKTIRRTQAKIEEMLHLSFETFTSSAFLRQGHANEFSKKSPKDRKEILANILNLNNYEHVKKRALEKIKAAQIEHASIITYQKKIESTLEDSASVDTELKKVKQQLTQITTELEAAAQATKELKEQKALLISQQKEHALIALQHTQKEQEHTKEHKILVNAFTTWRSVHKQLLTTPDHTALSKKRTSCFAAVQEAQEQLQKHLALKEQLFIEEKKLSSVQDAMLTKYRTQLHETALILERITTQKHALSQQRITIACTYSDKEAEQKNLGKQVTQLIKTLENRNSLDKTQTLQKQFEKRKEHYQRFITQGNMLQHELKKLQEKTTLVGVENPSCPLCEQNLSASRKKFLATRFAQKQHRITHKLNRMRRVITNLKQLLIEQHGQLKQHASIAELLTEKKRVDNELQTLKQQISQIDKEITQLTTKEKAFTEDLKTLQQSEKTALLDDTHYCEQQKRVKDTQLALKKIAYDQRVHKSHEAELVQIDQQLKDIQALRDQAISQQERKKIVSQQCILLKKLQRERKQLAEQEQRYASLQDQADTLKQKEVAITQKIQNLSQQKETILHAQGGLEHKRAQCKLLKKELTEYQKKQACLKTEIEEYQEIATATSKNGIQALLIEEAIPEIEQEANRLLGKLTNNQAHIFIESLRDLKKGGTKETLDINISDQAGIRPYEMFSGGEAFRIDFALRIALSKLLARRAGTALETLIIDEGFGSQDEEGLSNIMDAIYKIQDDFSKVIIVSHLTSMKNQFPVHFTVQKGPRGSTVHVIEQG